jgi:predicted small secreted protein
MISSSNRGARALCVSREESAHRRRVGLLGLAVLLVAGMMLTACNTTAGAGEDVKATGAAVTRGANDVKSKL